MAIIVGVGDYLEALAGAPLLTGLAGMCETWPGVFPCLASSSVNTRGRTRGSWSESRIREIRRPVRWRGVETEHGRILRHRHLAGESTYCLPAVSCPKDVECDEPAGV